MISVEEALEKVLSYSHVLEPENKPLTESLGQVLAEDIYSDFEIPPLDNSAMDGYAVQSESTEGASKSSPRLVKILGEVAAGYLSREQVGPGTAVRIMTGAPIPDGADAVDQFEDTDEEQRKASAAPLAEIGIMRQVEAGLNIRRAGEDIARGSLVLKTGVVLRPQEIGVLASLGRAQVPVIRRPLVAILATGDELVKLGRQEVDVGIRLYCVPCGIQEPDRIVYSGRTFEVLGVRDIDEQNRLMTVDCVELH